MSITRIAGLILAKKLVSDCRERLAPLGRSEATNTFSTGPSGLTEGDLARQTATIQEARERLHEAAVVLDLLIDAEPCTR